MYATVTEISNLSFSPVMVYAMLGLAANVFADLVIRLRYAALAKLDSRPKQIKRWIRWLVILIVMIVLALTGISFQYALPFALLSVTAATDFEQRRIPWDWFLYGSVLVGLLMAYLYAGLDGLSHAIIAQAVLYAFITFAVVVIGQTRGGDIKIAMQYGSVCANLSLALNGMLLASIIVMVPLTLISLATTRRMPKHAPLASYMWVSVLLALFLGGRYAFI